MVLDNVKNTNTMNNAYTINNAGLNHTGLPLAMPVSTATIWGLGTSRGADSAIWGTLGSGAVSRKQDFSAIWGTSAAVRSSVETIQ
jgi:hypothetical protein